MRNIEGLEALSLFNVHVQNIIRCGETIFNGNPDQVSMPVLFESMERVNKFMDDIKLQANTSVSKNNSTDVPIVQG